MSGLLDYIDRATFEAACVRLGTSPDAFWKLSGAEFQALIDSYIKECEDYIARQRARDDQMEAAYRLTADVPDSDRDVPLYELAKRGVIDEDEFIAGIQTLVRVQAEDEADPNPADENVAALLFALQRVLGGDG